MNTFQNNRLISPEVKEELHQFPLKVEGQIPTWLSGTLIRNGPVNVSIDGKTNSHWFDGLDKLPKKGNWESAHPHVLSAEGKTLNYCIQYGAKSHYLLYYLADDKFSREVISKISVQNPAYMHSFAITENYLILTEFPFTVKPLQLLLTSLHGNSFINNFFWHPELGTTFIVINRHTGELIGKYNTDSFFAFHHVNAYEVGHTIHLDIVCYENVDIIQGLATHFRALNFPGRIDEEPYPTTLKRFHLSLETMQLDSEVIFTKFAEFPRINEKLDGKPYQYIYMIDPRHDVSAEDIRPIYKIDLQTRQVRQWVEKGCYPGEPIFVKNPTDEHEDAGVILTVVLDQTKNSSFLLVLDARTMQEIARATIHHKIPSGLHGQFFAN